MNNVDRLRGGRKRVISALSRFNVTCSWVVDNMGREKITEVISVGFGDD